MKRDKRNKPTAIVATVPAVPVVPVVPVVDVPVVPAVPTPLSLSDVIPADVIPAAFTPPSWLYPMRDAMVTLASMPTKTADDRRACVDAYVAAMVASTGITADPVGKHTGRFTGMAVFETQNAIYMACALANVVINDGHIVAAWRAELPHAKCDYIGHAYDRGYPTTTLSLYGRGGHNGGVIPGQRDAVVAWAKRGRKPIPPTPTPTA